MKLETCGQSELGFGVFTLDPVADNRRIARSIREHLRLRLRRRGLVLGLSGGVDSSVCAPLAVEAVGVTRTFAL